LLIKESGCSFARHEDDEGILTGSLVGDRFYWFVAGEVEREFFECAV
jgi:hypothetical protein